MIIKWSEILIIINTNKLDKYISKANKKIKYIIK